jgi:hypothetical protein
MRGSNMPDRLLRRKQFEAIERERTVTLLRTLICEFENMIADLDGQIAIEENRTGVKDTGHPAYSSFAKAAAKRRQNLLTSVAQTKSMLEIAKHELDEVALQFHSTPQTISAAR